MRAHRLLFPIAITVPVVLAGCTPPRPAASPPSPVAAAPAPKDPTDSLVAAMSIHDKVGQLIVPWLPGSYTARDDSSFVVASRWIDSIRVGGIIISVGAPLDVAAKLNALQSRARVPLVIGADLEYGAGMRLVGGTSFPAIMAAGATGSPDDAYAIGRAAALEGRAVGIHIDFAPDADLNNNPLNPIINTRSFGEDPVQVSRLVTAFVHGVQDNGMLATLKHFPGHGNTGIDSHIGLPFIGAGYAHLDSLELIPFRAGIAAGVAVVMSAHIALPAITGNDDPGTLSHAVLTGMLRDSLKFKGLVVTDALTMGAIVTKYGAGEATVRAFLAGSDLLLMPADPDSAMAAMTQAVVSGRIAPARLDSSLRAVLEAKYRLGLFARRTVPLDSIMGIVGSKAFQDQANDIAARGLTLVRDSAGTLWNIRRRRSRVALVAYGDELNGSVGQLLTTELRAGGDTVEYFRLWPMSGPASYDSARVVMARASTVIFTSVVRPLSGRGTIALPDSLARLIAVTDSAKPTVLISLGSPYLLDQVPSVRSYLLGWSDARAVERALGDALLGKTAIGGHLPIRVPPYPLGWGISLSPAAP
ncbi:MAG TPA: glycoside hydrolase family 3 N-terminal domain-containing protein [Gemmatimonadales bacterium]|nr:glycoside hydrolase family 3 N-terminal domain-containing protein [Gemmatimonadales bacterium]